MHQRLSTITVPFFISHLGCPHTCVFCNQRIISGFAGKLPDADEIIGKVRSWQTSSHGRLLEVAFFGGTFTALPVSQQDQLLAPLQPLLRSKEVSSIRISTRPDCIDAEQAQRLAGQGVKVVELGVQSMNDAVLAASGRGHTASASEKAIYCLKDQGFVVGAQLMPGLPNDTAAISLESLKRVISCGADFVRIYPALVLQGTELSRLLMAGEYQPLSLDDAIQICKRLLLYCLKNGIDVIRMGLQAEQGLDAETILAGPWHPAFGQLVRSELYFELIMQMWNNIPGATSAAIRCHPNRFSDVIGQNHKNQIRLNKQGLQIHVSGDEGFAAEELAFEWCNQTVKGNINQDLNHLIEV